MFVPVLIIILIGLVIVALAVVVCKFVSNSKRLKKIIGRLEGKDEDEIDDSTWGDYEGNS